MPKPLGVLTRCLSTVAQDVHMWSYDFSRKGPHPYLSSFFQTNIAPLGILQPDQNGPPTRVLLVCVCSGTF